MIRPLLLHILCCAAAALVLALPAVAQVTVRGVVLDAETGMPLGGAHVVVLGASIGSVTSSDGGFVLTVAELPITLSIRHVGYETATSTIDPETSRDVEVELSPSVFELGAVLVSGEDPAVSIMRKVIASKQRWRSRLRSYAAHGFTRLILERDETIVLMSDVGYDVYWHDEHGPREVVHTVSRTAEWHSNLPVHAAGHVPDLYADYVDVQGLPMIGPTHPDALDHYRFRMAGRRTVDEGLVYDIYVSPRDARRATFIGTISVLGDVFVMLHADLRPARHVTFPAPLEAWRVAYIERFEHAGDSIWLPAELRAEGTFRLALDARTRRSVGVRQHVRLSDYRLNVPLPEAPFDSARRVTYTPSARWPDPLFLQGRQLIPFSDREESALARLRENPPTLRQAFPPDRRDDPLAAFLRGDAYRPRLTWPTIFGYQFRFRYNRVDGFLSSIGQYLDGRRLEIDWRLAQASGLSRVRAHVHGRYRLAQGFVGGGYTRGVEPWPQNSRYALPATSLQASLSGDDYFDYFWTQRFVIEAGLSAGPVLLSMNASLSDDKSIERELTRSWPVREMFRPNPSIDDGRVAAVGAGLGLDEGHRRPTDVVQHAELHVEHAPGMHSLSDFGFTRVTAAADIRVETVLKHRPEPATLALGFSASASRGDLPVQHFTGLDGSMLLFDAVGMSRRRTFRSLRGRPVAGEHHASLVWEHDFRTLPFEWLRLWPLVHRSTGLALYGAHGRTWLSDAALERSPFAFRYHDAFVNEIGLALTGVWATPLRLNVTYRLDEPDVFVGIGFHLH